LLSGEASVVLAVPNPEAVLVDVKTDLFREKSRDFVHVAAAVMQS
jgi:hypothetical protein